jgi:hypothetical protein
MSSNASTYAPLPTSNPLIETLVAHYGLPLELFDEYAFWERTDSGAVSISPKDAEPGDYEYESFGMLVLRKGDRGSSASTAFLRRFGHLATRSRVDLEGQQLADYLAGKTIDYAPDDERRGFVVVVGPHGPVGRAVWRHVDDRLFLESELARPYRILEPVTLP